MSLINRTRSIPNLAQCETYFDFHRALNFQQCGNGVKKRILAQIQGGAFCAYCDKTDTHLVLEHLYPRKHGGKDTLWNLVLACGTCNNIKGGYLPNELFQQGYPELAQRVLALEQERDNGNATLAFGMLDETCADFDFKRYNALQRFRATAGFGNWIAMQLDRHHMSITRFRKEMGISGWQPERWLAGDNLPTIPYYYKMCKLFNVHPERDEIANALYTASQRAQRIGMLTTRKTTKKQQHAVFDAVFDAEFDAVFDAVFDAEFDAEFDAVFDAEFDAVFDAEFDAVFAVTPDTPLSPTPEFLNRVLRWLAMRWAFTGMLYRSALASPFTNLGAFARKVPMPNNVMHNIFHGRHFPSRGLTRHMLRTLCVSPKRFFDGVQSILQHPKVYAYLQTTEHFRIFLMKGALRRERHRRLWTTAQMAEYLSLKHVQLSESYMSNLLGNTHLHNEPLHREACQALGLNLAFIDTLSTASETEAPDLFPLIEMGTPSALSAYTIRPLLRKRLALLKTAEFVPYLQARAGIAAAVAEITGTERDALREAVNRYGSSLSMLKAVLAGNTLPSEAWLARLAGGTVNLDAFYQRAAELALAEDCLKGHQERRSVALPYKVAFAKWMRQTDTTFGDVAERLNLAEETVRGISIHNFKLAITTLKAACAAVGIDTTAADAPTTLRLDFTYNVPHYVAALKSLNNVMMSQMTSEVRIRRYVGFRLAIAAALKAAIADTSMSTLTDACGVCYEHVNLCIKGRRLIAVDMLNTLLETTGTGQGAFWSDVHALLRQPGFLDALPQVMLEAIRLKRNIACILERNRVKYLQALPTPGRYSVTDVQNACTAYLPASLDTLKAILTELEDTYGKAAEGNDIEAAEQPADDIVNEFITSNIGVENAERVA